MNLEYYDYNDTDVIVNKTRYIGSPYKLRQDDSNWVVSNAFIIFTMQTGFGMLESGCVSLKNEVNIMMKNVVDIVVGGLTYWLFGFGISFGTEEPRNPFFGIGGYLIDPKVDDDILGEACAAFLFQLSFATTSTTIVSGAMAERCNFKAYCIFSSLNTIVYCVPAGWVWGDHGFLNKWGAVDIAGSGTVHLVGGVSALACAIMLGPRLGRYDNGIDPLPLGCPVNAILGLFVLWWGWLGFNSGSTYGVNGEKWKYAARAAVSTIMASMGGGLVGLIISMSSPEKGINILSQINGILGALVSITGGCFLFRAWESVIVGMIGGLLTCLSMPILDKLGIDDPVGASATHGTSGIWGMIAIGFFADDPKPLTTTKGRKGLFKGGGWYLLGIQSLTVLCLATWSFITSLLLLWIVNKIIPIRMSVHEELLGADLVEHHIRHTKIGLTRAFSALRPFSTEARFANVVPVGQNPGHESFLTKYKQSKKFEKMMKLVRRYSKTKNTLFKEKNTKTPEIPAKQANVAKNTNNNEKKTQLAWIE
ncbi:putative ammonium transporter 3 [Leptopilina heterotoma]|uniref:putative ammonium transporter 3 n=1 Tax=Leptopilina heterotoma TaxID=63436 RepID=UPI001CA8AD0A|nr:putative ammonium transporter 3 [Leptopilina heterotoma]